ncbi:MAG: hypothetical protein COW73_06280 [Nitrospirae bacterium CG18_big_fil_WC_8_21_14_2_50_70_55]|nr:cytochrome c-type biogenesis protein CcmH [Deltaproteobacteria bacterium]PIQ05284.1 MAG: hypothetical protein COW73_06280 [Nitrospirae bacterium CG18_big_fil_WC_8_21_14_2_50_70_55]PIU77261.1 MAG: hypothetical protein COS73_11485 [Nitrospirae bacterium CG06_land_8_20_14_3_00_70_43]PIW81940.1 MAG: hypothetical protein COZ96_11295 [Nitrospirae bacterium CG_4_8_14_3_um_filter_70_85]PIX83375.1 MAG: hypothetical protein COZ33_05770 [Nitrospirae bacterium CG_4_10_14_3_um_filter_70_108]HBB41161.1 h
MGKLITTLFVAWLVAAAGVASAASVHTSLTDPEQVKRFHAICKHLICQCGCNLVLDDCNHFQCGSATPMRARVDKEILDGKGDQEIINGFVEDMGLVVLSAPPTSGFNLTAWIAPGVLLSIAVVVILVLLRRWSTLPRAATPGVGAGTPGGVAGENTPAGGAPHSTQIEKELRDL